MLQSATCISLLQHIGPKMKSGLLVSVTHKCFTSSLVLSRPPHTPGAAFISGMQLFTSVQAVVNSTNWKRYRTQVCSSPYTCAQKERISESMWIWQTFLLNSLFFPQTDLETGSTLYRTYIFFPPLKCSPGIVQESGFCSLLDLFSSWSNSWGLALDTICSRFILEGYVLLQSCYCCSPLGPSHTCDFTLHKQVLTTPLWHPCRKAGTCGTDSFEKAAVKWKRGKEAAEIPPSINLFIPTNLFIEEKMESDVLVAMHEVFRRYPLVILAFWSPLEDKGSGNRGY